jgi:Family of unknown function (DUF6353)
MLTGLVQTAQKMKVLLNANSHTLLTGVGVISTISSVVLTGRATFKAADVIRETESVIDLETAEEVEWEPLTTLEKVRLVWPLYIPPTITLTMAIVSIVVANKVASTKIAALTLASGISERALQEYKEKVAEKLGPKQAETMKDEIAQRRVDANPVEANEVLATGMGDVLCYDAYTGRYFMSTVEQIRRAENQVNFQILHHMDASLSDFYDEIGLPATSLSDSVGWNADRRVEMEFSTTMSSDKRPCISIDFKFPPTAGYALTRTHNLHQ